MSPKPCSELISYMNSILTRARVVNELLPKGVGCYITKEMMGVRSAQQRGKHHIE